MKRRWSLRSLTMVWIVCLWPGALTLAQQGQLIGWQQEFQAGNNALKAGRLQDAETSFLAVTRENPKFAGGFLNLGLTLSSLGQHKDAMAALERAADLSPRLQGAHLFLGIEHYYLSEYAQAVEELKIETSLNREDVKAWIWMGMTRMATGNAANAAEALDKAAELDPDDVDIMYYRGQAHMQLAEDIYIQMLKKHPNSWRIHQVLAQTLEMQGNTTEAIVEYKRAIEAAPHEHGLHEAMGDIEWEQNNLDDARRAYGEEIGIDRFNAIALYKLGAIAVLQSDAQSAVPLLKQALALNPKLYTAQFWMGDAKESLDQLEEAASNYEAVGNADQEDVETQMAVAYHLSRVYRKLHQPEKSAASLAHFEQLRKAEASEKDQRAAKIRRAQLGMDPENPDPEKPKE